MTDDTTKPDRTEDIAPEINALLPTVVGRLRGQYEEKEG